MFLKHLSIQNFKGLVHCEVDLEPGFNLLIGDNGKGKTSILEAASVALGGFIAGIDHIPSKHIVESEESTVRFAGIELSKCCSGVDAETGFLQQIV